MGERYENTEVPFVKIGNRRALLAIQLMREPWLQEFVERFPASFEYVPNLDALFFIEPA